MRHRVFGTVYGILGGLILLSVAAFAQDLNPGKLKITVTQASVHIRRRKSDRSPQPDDQAGCRTHHLVVANYGYKFVERDISIDSHQTLPLDIQLEPAGGDSRPTRTHPNRGWDEARG